MDHSEGGRSGGGVIEDAAKAESLVAARMRALT
jgi:hypothetical protein